ncbi:MAG: endolytic transglycosylase MltG [Sulfobacillus sp.]
MSRRWTPSGRKRAVAWVAGCLLIALAVAVGSWWWTSGQPVGGHFGAQLFTVRPGESASEVASALASRRLVRSALYVRIFSGMVGAAGRLKAGTYLISGRLSTQAILALIVSGQVASRRLVVPEGFTVRQIAGRLSQLGVVSAPNFLAVAMAYHNPYLSPGAAVLDPAEGYLFPSTYQLPYGISARQVFAILVATFDQKFAAALRQEASAEGLSVNQVVTLASMVQQEAFLAKDMPLVAAVFLNRLKAHMPLGSDATISYALGVPGNQLTGSDLASTSPYNTLHTQGLPPGPISNPGLATILAVLHPAHVSYLYFFSLPSGQEIFSNTYAEQQAARKAAGY